MNAEEKGNIRPRRASLRTLIEKWGQAIHVSGAIASVVVAILGVVVATIAIIVQQDITRQEVRRAAIGRSIALYDYFMNSTHIKELMALQADVHRNYSEKEKKTRQAMIESLIKATGDQDEIVHKNLALMLHDFASIAKCGGYETGFWKDGQILTDDSQPLCDRGTFRTLLFGPLSELFFTYRYFFYCDGNLRIPYWKTIRKFEVTIADYIHNDHKLTHPDPEDKIWVFLEDRDEERAINEGLMRSSETFYILRLAEGGKDCAEFNKLHRNREKRGTESGSSHAEPELPSS